MSIASTQRERQGHRNTEKCLVVLAVATVATLAVSCNTLRDVKQELERGGFGLWYPAEEGIEPGQIWMTDGETTVILQRRPETLPVMPPHDSGFLSLEEHIEAKISLDAKFSNELLGKAGDVSLLLKSVGVKDVKLDLGKTTITRLVLGDLKESTVLANLPDSYKADLQKVRTRRFPLVLIVATVQASGMTYTFTCEDTSLLELKAPEIAKAINANFDLDIKSKRTAAWRIPEDKKLVIGICPLSGDSMELTKEAQLKAAKETVAALKALKTVGGTICLLENKRQDDGA